MLTHNEVLLDASNQLATWATNEHPTNNFKKNMFGTGYGGPFKPLEQISKPEWAFLLKAWVSQALVEHRFSVVPSLSADEKSTPQGTTVWDLVCGYKSDAFRFVFHIAVVN